MIDGNFSTCGKQVLRGGVPFADACTNDAATLIAAFMNVPDYIDAQAELLKSAGSRLTLRVIASGIRACLHVPEGGRT
jgi:hypothetical protein